MTRKYSIPSIFTVKEPRKPPKEPVRKEIEIVDLAHSARKEQRVYCLAHTNKLIMKHYPDQHMWRCETCAYTILEGYGQSLMKKKKEDIKYHIINDPYYETNVRREGERRTPAGIALHKANERKLEEIADPISKDSIKYHSATDAMNDVQEYWY